MTLTYEEWVEQNPLRAWRLANAVSQFTAARRIGVTPGAVWRYEHGRMDPRTEVLNQIARITKADETLPAQARHDIAVAWSAWRDQSFEDDDDE